jgi:hypothetical protein
MAETEEIRMPDDPARLLQHRQVDVLVTLVGSQGDERPVLAGRCVTQHLRPNGAILVVRPPITGASPLKRADLVRAKFRRSQSDALEATGVVSWVRAKAFLPSGLSVSLIGITFDWDPEEMTLEVAAFLSAPSAAPPR